MRIKILAVDTKVVAEGKKNYTQLDVSYKNLDFQGKVEGKKIISFASPDVFQALKDAKAGDEFDVTKGEKSAQGFVPWTRCTPATGDSASESQEKPAVQSGNGTGQRVASTPRSTYETPEERAKKQVYIVRQSSISNALTYFANDEPTPDVKDILAVAKQFEQYVFGNDPVQALIDMDDDIPL